MNIIKNIAFILVGICMAATTQANINVFTCEPEWADLARQLGGDHVKVYSATTAFQDPHRIEARPSLIAKIRRADLVVCTGAELEIGWLPMLQRQAGNSRIQSGQPGYFETAMIVERLDIPQSIDRSQGDIHASGNPHVHLDPRRIVEIAKHLSARLQQLDADNRAYFKQRYTQFKSTWQASITQWQERARPLAGKRVVTYHRDFIYLLEWLGMQSAGELEPRPGLPPSPGHLARLKQGITQDPAIAIVYTPYQDSRPAEWLARETGVAAIMLPYTVGGSDNAKDLQGMFNETIDILLKAMQ
jgi:zinc/manganese transport system substrate-binding protein